MSKEPKQKGKIRVFLFELEGSDDTLLASVKSITDAVNKTFSAPIVAAARQLPRPINNTPPQNASPEDDREETIEGEPIDEDETFTDNSSKSSQKRIRRFRAPKILNDLDLDSGEMPFTTFWEEKSPSTDLDKYLVCAAWFREYRNINEIGNSHVFTCSKIVKDWTTPSDVGSVFRSGKKATYFSKGSSSGSYEITITGLNRVKQMVKKP